MAFIRDQYRKSSGKYVRKSVDTLLNDVKSRLIRDAKLAATDVGINAANKLHKHLSSKTTHRIGKFVLGEATSSMRSINNPLSNNLGYIIESNSKPIHLNEGSPIHHNLNIRIGRPVTDTVLSLCNQQGIKDLVLFDSLQSMKEKQSRQQLSSSFGFNQKLVVFFKDVTFLANDYSKIYNHVMDALDNPSMMDSKRIYGLNSYETSNIKVSSVNSYMDLILKFHLCEIQDNDIDVEMLFNTTYNSNLNQQELGKIPLHNQYSEPFITEKFCKILVSKDSSILQSNRFRAEAKVCKTMTNKIGPSDIMQYNYRYSCGPGTQLELVHDACNCGSKGTQPTSYFVVLEVLGCDCTGELLKDNTRVIGTSPGWIQFEMQKQVRLVSNSSILHNNLNLVNAEADYPVRIFDKKYYDEQQEFNVNINEIGSPFEKDKTFSVLTTSNKMVVSENQIEDRSYNSSYNSPLFKTFIPMQTDESEEEES